MAAKLIRQPDALPIEAHDEKSRQVAAWVLEELGTPRNLYRVDAKPLWDEYFRVNVYCRQDVGLSAKEMAVTDSFFVFQTNDGYLTNPPIERKYGL